MQITKALIQSGLSDRGGLNGPQLAILGVAQHQSPYAVVGQGISPEYAARFVELRNQGEQQKRRAASPLPSTIAGLPGAATFESEPGDDWHRLRFDGGCSTRPGAKPSGTWAYVVTDACGVSVAKDSGRVDVAVVSSNVAEWDALAEGLTRAAYVNDELRTKWAGLLIEGDSQLVVWALIGKWKCKAPHLIPLRDECLSLLAGIGIPWHSRWIPREMNAECDALAAKVARKAVR